MAESRVKRENYRKFYKDYYGIDFDKNYDIHHIDFNHDNNDISNLILLPRELHQKYHELVQQLAFFKDFKRFTICKMNTTYTADILTEFAQVLKEISPWVARQEYLELMRSK